MIADEAAHIGDTQVVEDLDAAITEDFRKISISMDTLQNGTVCFISAKALIFVCSRLQGFISIHLDP